jgi:hypothetical protein
MTMAVTATLPVALSGLSGVADAHIAHSSGDQALPVLPSSIRDTLPANRSSHRLVVKLSSGTTTSARSVAETLSPTSRRADSYQRVGGRWFALNDVRNVARAQRRLEATPGVEAVQVDRFRQAFGDEYYRKYQPYLRASMDVNAAWNRSSGRGVKVAVLDTGVDASHEDLPRVLRGRDFVSGDRKPQDPVGHGTFVAGVIAAERDNHRGIAGVSRATILPGRVLNAKGYGRDANIAKAIRWAVRERADIINLSLGGGRSGRILRDAVRFAGRHGVLVVASAGNSGGTREMYPAAFPEALAVGATDLRDRMVWWSQHGSWVDLVAPGYRIASTVPNDGYALGSGTSFSAPMVSGAAALVLAKHPRWTVDQLRSALLRGAADAGPVGPDTYTALGVLDVDGVLGGGAKAAVPSTGPLSGTAPDNARPLQHDSFVPSSSPEGTDRWFELGVSGPTRVTLTASLRSDRSGNMRGDVALALFDANAGRLDVADARNGAGTERVVAVVDDNVFLRVRNGRDTRWPANVNLGFAIESASAGNVEVGTAPRPVLVGSTPLPESYAADPNTAITISTGVDVKASSVDGRSVQLVDGESGAAVPIAVVPGPGQLTITPDDPLSLTTTYTVALDGVRNTAGARLPYTRLGFRTAS